MKTQIFIVISIFTLSFQSTTAVAKSPSEIAKKVSALFSEKDFLLLGEATHKGVPQYKLLSEVLDTVEQVIDFVVLEKEEITQTVLDKFLTTSDEEVEIPIGVFYGDSKTKAAFTEMLGTIRRINLSRIAQSKIPIKVIAIDDNQPATDESTTDADTVKKGREWFLNRDQHMFERFQKNIKKGSKGIFFMGAAHLTKTKYQWPEMVVQMFELTHKEHQSLGTYIAESNEFKDKAAYFWIQPKFEESDWQFIPPAMHSVYKTILAIENNPYEFFLTSSDPRIKIAEEKHKPGTDQEDPTFTLGKHFDYVIRLGDERPAVSKCEIVL